MKTLVLVMLSIALLAPQSLFAAENDSVLIRCGFLRSMSVSFGYDYVYTFRGRLKDVGGAGNHFFEVDGPVAVSVDRTASTNVPASHVLDAAALINNHPSGNRVMLDLVSETFRILVFTNPARSGVWDAYEMDGVSTSVGLAGVCRDLGLGLQAE